MNSFKKKNPTYQDHLEAFKKIHLFLTDNQDKRLILLWGESDFLLYQSQQKISAFVEENFAVKSKNFDSSAFASEADLVTELSQQDLFSSVRFHCLELKPQDKQLEACLKAISKSSWQKGIVILTFAKASLSTQVLKTLARQNVFLCPCFTPKNSYEQKAYLQQICSELDLKLSSSAKNLILDFYKYDLYETQNILRQLAYSYPSKEHVVVAEELSSFCSVLQDEQIFKLIDFLLKLQYQKAEVYCLGLLRSGTAALSLLGVFSFHLRQALRFIEEKEGLVEAKDLPPLRMPPRVREAYKNYIRRVPKKVFLEAYSFCYEIDTKIKTSVVSEEVLLARLFYKLSAWQNA